MHHISVLLYNIPCYTKKQLTELLDSLQGDETYEYDLTMMADYMRVEFSRFADDQDNAIIETLSDLEYLGLRQLVRSIEMEVYS